MNLADYNKTYPTTFLEAVELIQWLMDRIDQLYYVIEDLEGDC